jgi:carboxyl-terminal processing protease
MSNLVRAFLLSTLLLAVGGGSYYAGYTADHHTAQSAAPAPTPSPTPTAALQSHFDLFWEVWQLVDGEFYDRAALDYDKLTYGAIRGMLEALGDPHTSFADPEVARVSEDDMRGSFDGIGVQIEIKDGKLTVVAPIEGTPGERAGLRAGDVITRIDDADAAQLSLMDAVARIRGPRGTAVRLTIFREGTAEPLVFEVIRAEIKPVNIRSQMLPGSIGYIRLSNFTASSGDEVKAAVAGLLEQHPKGLILDLRNNPGGLLQSAIDVSSQFLKEGVVLYEKRRDADAVAFNAKPGGLATDLPMVVLVNKGSASASEIVAGALQDHGRAILVGESTFGKDSVQNIHKLSNGASARITFARWYTPKRQDISEKGLVPDVAVPLTPEDAQAQRDPQLDRAVEYLAGK